MRLCTGLRGRRADGGHGGYMYGVLPGIEALACWLLAAGCTQLHWPWPCIFLLPTGSTATALCHCREPAAGGSGSGGGRPSRGRLALDCRTRNAVAAVLRQSELLGSADLDEAAEEQEEEQRRQLRGLLS